MTSKERNMIKAVANKTGIGVTTVRQGLDDFKELNIKPTGRQLAEYLKLKLSAIAYYTLDEEGNRVPWNNIDYINKVME